MKVVILAGGFGTRISEESHLKPKPMIEIGEKPILWHIMKQYSHYGFNEFVICCGYKQHMIKEWFADYYLYNCDVTFDFTNDNQMTVHNNVSEPWKVTLVDTGINTMTGGRVKRIQKYIGNETFMLTYGDAVSDIDINKLLQFHRSHGKTATITAVSLGQRFGILDIDVNHTIRNFREKDVSDGSRINAGFMVLEPEIFDYIKDDTTLSDIENLPRLQRPSLGGGALGDLGYFLLAFSTMIFGNQIKRIQSSCAFTPMRVDRQLSMVLQYKDDRMAVLSCTTSGNGESRAVIQGTKGYIVVEDLRNFASATVYDSRKNKTASYKRGKIKSEFEFEMTAFTAAMKSGWKECPEIPHAQTLSMMQMMDFIRRQLGISYEDIQISQIPNMIEGSAAAHPTVQDMSASAGETAAVSAEETVPSDVNETSEGQDIPEAEFEEVTEDTAIEEKTE